MRRTWSMLLMGFLVVFAEQAATAELWGGRERPPRPMGLIRSQIRSVARVRLSSKASSQGVELTVLSPRRTRYIDGAPIVVSVQPALVAAPPSPVDRAGFTACGFVVINVGYPRGKDFDAGGPRCKRAVADAFLFAMGKKKDQEGRTIDQVCDVKVCTNIVGAVGWSHGGNGVVTTLEAHADELRDLGFYVSYESPAGTSTATLGDSITVDYGGVEDAPTSFYDADGDGFPWDDGRNPWYSWKTGLDLSRLAWDAGVRGKGHSAARSNGGVLFIDGNGNGRLDVATSGPLARARAKRRPPTDINGDGRIDKNEDFPLSYLTYEFKGCVKRVYSLNVTRAAARTVFQGGFPPYIATEKEALAYWSERDMAAQFDRLSPELADLMVCICSGRQDHVQAQPDYPHIRAQYEGLRAAGVRWVRINPDPVYLRAFVPETTAAFPSNPPNVPVSPQTMWKRTEPTRGELSKVVVVAAVCELADRLKANNRSPRLRSVLFPYAPYPHVFVPPLFWASERLDVTARPLAGRKLLILPAARQKVKPARRTRNASSGPADKGIWEPIGPSGGGTHLVFRTSKGTLICSHVGGGVFRREPTSIDWSIVRATEDDPYGLVDVGFSCMAEAPEGLYGGGAQGLWFSADDGKTWRPVDVPFEGLVDPWESGAFVVTSLAVIGRHHLVLGLALGRNALRFGAYFDGVIEVWTGKKDKVILRPFPVARRQRDEWPVVRVSFAIGFRGFPTIFAASSASGLWMCALRNLRSGSWTWRKVSIPIDARRISALGVDSKRSLVLIGTRDGWIGHGAIPGTKWRWHFFA